MDPDFLWKSIKQCRHMPRQRQVNMPQQQSSDSSRSDDDSINDVKFAFVDRGKLDSKDLMEGEDRILLDSNGRNDVLLDVTIYITNSKTNTHRRANEYVDSESDNGLDNVYNRQ